MSRQLRIASVYKVELEYGGLCNDEQRAFLRLLYLLDIKIDFQSDDENNLEISRSELERLHGILAGDNKTYTENTEAIDEILSEANITRERMTEALCVMITCSDQNDSLVHIFCE